MKESRLYGMMTMLKSIKVLSVVPYAGSDLPGQIAAPQHLYLFSYNPPMMLSQLVQLPLTSPSILVSQQNPSIICLTLL